MTRKATPCRTGNHRHRGAFHLAPAAQADRAARRPNPGRCSTSIAGVRIKDMDEAGIDIAVLSENNPAAHNLDAGRRRSMAAQGVERFSARADQGQSRRASRASRAAAARSEGRGRRARALRRPGSAARRHDHGDEPGPVRRRQEVPAGVRARVEARRAGLHPSVADEARDRRGVLQGSRRRIAGLAARLRARDADAHVPADHLGPVRRISEPEDHRRPSRRDRAVHAVADRAQCGEGS